MNEEEIKVEGAEESQPIEATGTEPAEEVTPSEMEAPSQEVSENTEVGQ